MAKYPRQSIFSREGSFCFIVSVCVSLALLFLGLWSSATAEEYGEESCSPPWQLGSRETCGWAGVGWAES